MSDAQAKWDAVYRKIGEVAEPLSALREYTALLPARGIALDLACGRAANAEFLARRGLTTSAWDISPVVINQVSRRFDENALTIDTQVRDVVAQPPAPETFDVIVVARFLERSLAPAITDALTPGGVLVYQTFVSEKVNNVGPTNPDYLLATNELLTLFARLTARVLLDLGCCGDVEFGLRNEALLIAQKSVDV
ncbi:MAG: class I SAM-dependent methyltransferase [Pseudomonadota bacterium]